MRRFALALALLVSTSAFATTDPLYDKIRAARPDGRYIEAEGVTLTRDAHSFRFDDGRFYLLTAADGRNFGAVFLGNGAYELTPAMESERKKLAFEADDAQLKTLRDNFTSAVFLFTDTTFNELSKDRKVETAAVDAKAADRYEQYLKFQKKKLTTNVHLRVAQGVANPLSTMFFAQLDGAKLPPLVAATDTLGFEALRLSGRDLGGEETALLVVHDQKGGLWYLSHTAAEVKAGVHEPKKLVEPLAYTVDTKIAGNTRIEGSTVLSLRTIAPALRVLPIDLMPKLRISDVQTRTKGSAEWTAVNYVQEVHDEDPDAGIFFAQALPPNSEIELKVTYAGSDVLEAGGDKNFYVGARTNWYANVGTFQSPTPFDLTYRIPAGNDLVSVGKIVEEKSEGDVKIIHARSTQPLRVAGFNYGKFKKLERTDEQSKLTVRVHTNPGTPNVIKDINAFFESQVDDGEGVSAQHIKVDAKKLADSALVDGLNAARTGVAYFGPLAHNEVEITQQSQWSFGQSWPGLIFLPYISFLDSTQRATLGMTGAQSFIDSVGMHEFAHQWWGHQVGWGSYRDQWLSEGFSEFSAALALQQTMGTPRYVRFWENARQHITEKPRGGLVTNDKVGPITLGWRLGSWKNGDAYSAMVYSKGGYVLHMLRGLMAEPGKQNPDARFIAMMTDFAQSYAGKNPTTADFQRTVEKHITPTLNIYGNGKADWFFAQWVDGIEIPRFKQKLDVQDLGGGKYKIKGTVSQEEVGEQFFSFVPLYLEFAKGQIARVSMVPLLGAQSKEIDLDVDLPMKPKRAAVNLMNDVLAR